METDSIINEIQERSKRRSAVLWSKGSIIGYVWDVIRNLLIIVVVLGIFNHLSNPSDVIIVSILVLIFLDVIVIGAQQGQILVKNTIQTQVNISEILEKLGKVRSVEEKEEVEKISFFIEKVQYKFILNSIFYFIITIITLLNLLNNL